MLSGNDHPSVAVWETDRSRNVLHAQRGAGAEEDPAPLCTQEARRLLEACAAAGVPELVLATSGERDDLVELAAFARSLQLSTRLLFEAPHDVPRELPGQLARAGVAGVAVGINGQGVVTHEAFRACAGSFEASLRLLCDARAVGIATRVDTTLHAGNIRQIARIADLVELAGATHWNVTYLVPGSPGEQRLLPTPEAVEDSLEQLLSLANTRPFKVTTTGAPNYPRHISARGRGAPPRSQRELEKVDDRHFVFVSYEGDIQPNASLSVRCGNVRTDDLPDVYRHHLVFRLLRSPDMLGGKCRACGYRRLCAGSRARAYAVTGSLTAQDPLCAYMPPRYAATGEHRSVS